MQLSDDQVGGFVVLVWYVIVSTGAAVCFRKAGQPALTAFIPVVNAVQVCRLAGLSGAWVLAVFVPILNLFGPLYVVMKLSRRFGHSEFRGVVVWLSGFTLLPILAVGADDTRLPLPDTSDVANPVQHRTASPFAPPGTAAAVQQRPADTQHRNSRLRMIALSCFYGFGLLCVPGLLIIGTMSFGGATQKQVDDAGLVAGLMCLTPVSLLIAFAGGWILHARQCYSAASLLVALPILNGIAVCAGFVWVFS